MDCCRVWLQQRREREETSSLVSAWRMSGNMVCLFLAVTRIVALADPFYYFPLLCFFSCANLFQVLSTLFSTSWPRRRFFSRCELILWSLSQEDFSTLNVGCYWEWTDLCPGALRYLMLSIPALTSTPILWQYLPRPYKHLITFPPLVIL